MPYTMEDFKKYYREKTLAAISLEERLEGVSSEDLLKVFPPEERMKGLSSEVRTKDLSDEELERLLQLRRRRKAKVSSKKC